MRPNSKPRSLKSKVTKGITAPPAANCNAIAAHKEAGSPLARSGAGAIPISGSVFISDIVDANVFQKSRSVWLVGVCGQEETNLMRRDTPYIANSGGSQVCGVWVGRNEKNQY